MFRSPGPQARPAHRIRPRQAQPPMTAPFGGRSAHTLGVARGALQTSKFRLCLTNSRATSTRMEPIGQHVGSVRPESTQMRVACHRLQSGIDQLQAGPPTCQGPKMHTHTQTRCGLECGCLRVRPLEFGRPVSLSEGSCSRHMGVLRRSPGKIGTIVQKTSMALAQEPFVEFALFHCRQTV